VEDCHESMTILNGRLFVSAIVEPNQQKGWKKNKNYHAILEKS